MPPGLVFFRRKNVRFWTNCWAGPGGPGGLLVAFWSFPRPWPASQQVPRAPGTVPAGPQPSPARTIRTLLCSVTLVASDAGENEGEEQQEEVEEEEGEQEDVSSPGRIVWVSWGRMRYPAKVVLLAEVPANLQSCLRKGGRNTVLVKFYGSGDYSRVEIRKISMLGLTATDLKLAARSAQISQDYDAAQYDLRYGE